MVALPRFRERCEEKAREIETAGKRLSAEPSEPLPWLRSMLAQRDYVLFCGAGISVPPPASAPTFFDLRNGVVLALADLLADRGMIERGDCDAIESAIRELGVRVDLEVPPEHIFGLVRHAIGFPMVHQILEASLGRGQPNANHRAIRSLATSASRRPAGLITPNFDRFVEETLGGVGLRRTVADGAAEGEGWPLFKPHGSLEIPDSIAITVERVACPLRGSARRTFQDLVAGRVVVVFGYSGWDFDLFPLMVHAGREWGTEVVWVLHGDASMNERVAMIQLGLQDRCTVLNGRRQPLLAMMGGVEADATGAALEPLRGRFAEILGRETDDGLAAALLGMIPPIGVPDETGIVPRLCDALLARLDGDRRPDDVTLLARLGFVTGMLDGDNPTRRRAAGLAAECARRLGQEAAVREHDRLAQGKVDGEDAESRLRAIERDLDEFPYDFRDEPHPELAERSTRAGLRIDRAGLLMDVGRVAEAEALASRILDDTVFPESGVSEEAWTVDDGRSRWRLHAILGDAAWRRRDVAAADAAFVEALDVLWRELDFWNLGTLLTNIAKRVHTRNRGCAGGAMDLCARLSRYSGDDYGEVHSLEWKLHFGLGSVADRRRARELLDRMHLDPADLARHRSLLD